MATTLNSFLKPLNIDPAKLTKLTLGFRKTFEELAFNSDQQFLPTPVSLPDRVQDFDGLVLAIDVGGSHLRVGLFEGEAGHDRLKLIHGGDYQVIPEEVKAGTAEGLFSFIGEHIVDVLRSYQHGEQYNGACTPKLTRNASHRHWKQSLPVGITFSFPMIQHSIEEAILMPLGKGFTMKPGQKLNELLLAGYETHAGRISVSEDGLTTTLNGNGHSTIALPKLIIKAITNDTIATLVAGRHFASPDDGLSSDIQSLDPQETVLGLILATGTNATIALSSSALLSDKLSSIRLKPSIANSTFQHRILINTELSIRGSATPLRTMDVVTAWDTALDASTASPGFQPLEYMTSGRYLGELVRLILVDWLMNIQKIPRETLPPRLLRPWMMTTEYLSTVVAASNSVKKLAETLNRDFAPPSTEQEPQQAFAWTYKHAETLSTIAHRVQIRSSRIIGSACIALLLLSGDIQLKARQSIQTQTISAPSSHQNQPRELAITYTGAVIEKYPMYLATCQETIDALFFSLCKNVDGVERIVMKKVVEGGLRGAAMLAAGEMVEGGRLTDADEER